MAQTTTTKTAAAKKRVPPRNKAKKKPAQASPGRGVFERLKADHRRIRELSKELLRMDDTTSEEALTLYRQLRETVLTHAKAEEETFYEPLRARSAEKDDEKIHRDVMEGFEEHRVAEFLIHEIDDTAPESEAWLARVKVLTEVLRHHIDEEESEMFRGARKEMTASELRDLGVDFERYKSGLSEIIEEEEETAAVSEAELRE